MNNLNPLILYEDDDLLVIDKPTGVVVNRADSVHGSTIQDWMAVRLTQSNQPTKMQWESLVPSSFSPTYGTPEKIFAERQGIVHRLDKETSGALVLAKNPGSLVALLASFRERRVNKQYRCLVHGFLNSPEDRLEYSLARSSGFRLRQQVAAGGRVAVTRYKVVQEFDGIVEAKLSQIAREQLKSKKKSELYHGFSLVDCWPETGRTHQIRVHFAHIRHPLVADPLYGGRKRSTLDRTWCPRQFLHASAITLPHPRTRQPLEITCPLSADLTAVLTLLKSRLIHT